MIVLSRIITDQSISLLTAISKLFEKVVFSQLYDYFRNNDLFYDSQYGFLKNRSTEFAAMELTDKVLKDIDEKHITLAIFMDLSKAFDTLDHSILLQKLAYYGINGLCLEWFTSHLYLKLLISWKLSISFHKAVWNSCIS